MIIVREMKSEDIEGVQKIAKTTWRSTYKGIMEEDFIEEFINVGYSKKMIKSRSKDTLFEIAEYNNLIAGFINYIPDYFGPNQMALGAIYVDPIYQRKGIGTSLLNSLVEKLPKSNTLFADVDRKNNLARIFFENRGFSFRKDINAKIGNYSFDRIRVVLDR